MSAVKVSSRGQIVLPKSLREALSIRQGDRLSVEREGDHLVLHRLAPAPSSENWQAWRGILEGSGALRDHLEEHRTEAEER